MRLDPAQEAIAAALKGDWEVAIETNLRILKESSKDIEALNRLARAYSEVGNIKKARETAQTVLKHDPFNTIAARCLLKWKSVKNTKNGSVRQAPRDPKTFLEEPGKTKITALLYLGDNKTLASLNTGDELKLSAHQHRVSVLSQNGSYVGRLADDLSSRLRQLIKNGNKYEVLVKSVDSASVKVFLREISRGSSDDSPSFVTERIDYISFTPPELVHKKEVAVSEDE